MTGLIPFNYRNKNKSLENIGTGFEDFHNMLDDFFGSSLLPSRNLLHDTFKMDIEEKDTEYLLEAELPGVQKDEIDLRIEEDNLCIQINRSEESNKEGKNFIHKERRSSLLSRRVRLLGAKLDTISAKLENGVLQVTIPKEDKASNTLKINIE